MTRHHRCTRLPTIVPDWQIFGETPAVNHTASTPTPASGEPTGRQSTSQQQMRRTDPPTSPFLAPPSPNNFFQEPTTTALSSDAMHHRPAPSMTAYPTPTLTAHRTRTQPPIRTVSIYAPTFSPTQHRSTTLVQIFFRHISCGQHGLHFFQTKWLRVYFFRVSIHTACCIWGGFSPGALPGTALLLELQHAGRTRHK